MQKKTIDKEAERQEIIEKRRRENPLWWRAYTHLVASSTSCDDLQRVAKQLKKL